MSVWHTELFSSSDRNANLHYYSIVFYYYIVVILQFVAQYEEMERDMNKHWVVGEPNSQSQRSGKSRSLMNSIYSYILSVTLCCQNFYEKQNKIFPCIPIHNNSTILVNTGWGYASMKWNGPKIVQIIFSTFFSTLH